MLVRTSKAFFQIAKQWMRVKSFPDSIVMKLTIIINSTVHLLARTKNCFYMHYMQQILYNYVNNHNFRSAWCSEMPVCYSLFLSGQISAFSCQEDELVSTLFIIKIIVLCFLCFTSVCDEMCLTVLLRELLI